MNITIKIIPEAGSNNLTFSKNFRIFSIAEPIRGITGIVDILEDLEISSSSGVDISNLKRFFRYSCNNIDWSLWYGFTPISIDPNGLDSIKDIELDPEQCIHIEIKYEYDDGTFEELDSVIQIDEIKIRGKRNDPGLPNVLTPEIACTDEKCPALIFEREASFRPYQVDSAIGIYKELSFHTNKIFGHEVVYFRTVPESDSGDYIFKEWTLYKNVDRKCVKILVPDNNFPDNKPKFSEFGIDFEVPFEIHIDHRYFQTIFGNESEPRKRDFLYFPLINRMFEIQGSYLHRGFMMEPSYWKIQLYKFNPNIDMLMKDENRQYMDNIITSAEELFAEEVKEDIEDATMPEQYETISRKYDITRGSIHPDLKIKNIKFNFNYAPLMENYYDLSGIEATLNLYDLTSGSPLLSTSQEVVTVQGTVNNKKQFEVIRAYQESPIFKTWQNNSLMTNDKNVLGIDVKYLRVRGPFDTIPDHIGQSESGRYLQLEAYKDLSFSTQRNIMINDPGGAQPQVGLKLRETSIVYNRLPEFGTEEIDNLSYTSMFNVPSDSEIVSFINGYDNESQSGLYVYAQFNKYTNDEPEGDLILNIKVNDILKTYTLSGFESGKWHSTVISISNEFNQMGVYVYKTIEDPSDLSNHSDFSKIFENISSMQDQSFKLDQPYTIPTSNLKISNIRLFKTMIKEEQHDFILSQQFIKDESMLLLIDNCRPQVKVPFITRNR
tara:strand:- start:27396 stop:29555 length:2160 start_codon:yes stop_codon:yes gene_type:complete